METVSDFLEERPRVEGEFQHALPKLILRRFGINGEKKSIYVFNLSSRDISDPYIDIVGGNANIYDIETNKTHLSAESILDKNYENDAGQIITKILRNDSIQLGEKNKLKLSEFYCILYGRTEKWSKDLAREMLSKAHTDKIKHMRQLTPGLVSILRINANDHNMTRIFSINEMVKLAPEFCSKKWILLKTSEDHPFLLGDNPVVPWNFSAKEGEKYYIFGVETTIYIPLNPTRAIMLIDENLILESRGNWDTNKMIEFDEGYWHLNPEEVDQFNYMQICRADMVIFSNNSKFKILKTISELQGQLRENDFFIPQKMHDEFMEFLQPHSYVKHVFYHFKTYNKWTFPHANNVGQYYSMWWDVSEEILSEARVPKNIDIQS